MDVRPLKIAMLIGSMQEGGTEGQLIELIAGLRRRGHDVRLMLLHRKGALLDRVLSENIPVEGIELPKLRPMLNFSGKAEAWRCLGNTVRILREFSPDVFHCWLFEAEAWGWLAKRRKAPGAFVTSRRSLGDYKASSPWKQRLQFLYNRDTVAVVANSEAVRRDALKREKNLAPERVRVIYNGIDMERFRAAQPVAQTSQALAGASHLVLTVGNLFEYKGYYDLVEAWRIVGREFSDAHLLCAGRDAGIGDELRARIHGTGFNHRIHLIGPRTDVPSLLKRADLFVLASHEEGLPNAVIEAQAAGLPVIATRVGGTPEAIDEGRTGLLVPARNPEKLAASILAMLRDESKRREFARAAPEFVEVKFGLERMIDEYEKFYASIAERATSA